MAYDKQIPKKSENLSEWYTKTIQEAEISDYGPAKGTMIFRPYGYRIWELIQAAIDTELKKRGIENAYFPLFIPESLLTKEKDHIAGFAPELAVVTIGGGEELEERLVVRPTSETIMYDSYSRWIQSWRDLPMIMNQWNNVVRWEKRTYPFLRTSEFLWQEGHSAHANHDEAIELQRWAMDMYVKIYRDFFALAGYVGYKSESEKFAGADNTITFEQLMPEGKALQSCTSHDLGQNFSTSFDIAYQSKEGKKEYVWQTCWGFSTRSMGGLFMSHGDDAGLVLPPKIAPIQVVIIPVRIQEDVIDYCNEIARDLEEAGVRVKVDGSDGESFGFKINKWELKGVPIRFEVGPREVSERTATGTLRGKVRMETKPLHLNVKAVLGALDNIQQTLLKSSEDFLSANTHKANTYDEFKHIMATTKGFIKANWCEDAACEAKIKEDTTATTRCLPIDSTPISGACIHCDKPAKHEWIFGQSY